METKNGLTFMLSLPRTIARLFIVNVDVPDQVRTLSQVGTSSYMAFAMLELTQGVLKWLKKLLLGPVVLEIFPVSCLLINFVLESEFASGMRAGIKDVTLFNENVILINMNDLHEGDQSIIRDIPIPSRSNNCC